MNLNSETFHIFLKQSCNIQIERKSNSENLFENNHTLKTKYIKFKNKKECGVKTFWLLMQLGTATFLGEKYLKITCFPNYLKKFR